MKLGGAEKVAYKEIAIGVVKKDNFVLMVQRRKPEGGLSW
jgi:hypothetical protein